MLTLIVKGNRFEAARAAANRAIPFVFARETNKGRETVGRTGDAQHDKVAAWFVADVGDRAPYKVGSCLWYGEGRV